MLKAPIDSPKYFVRNPHKTQSPTKAGPHFDKIYALRNGLPIQEAFYTVDGSLLSSLCLELPQALQLIGKKELLVAPMLKKIESLPSRKDDQKGH